MMNFDYSLIEIATAEESLREFSYRVKKAAEGDYITGMFGWDETKQRDFHSRDWEQKRPMIISFGSKPIGTIYIAENENYLEIGQFFILPEYQNKGIGTHVLSQILDRADRSGLTIKLAHLRNNPAAALYRRHGFKTVEDNEQFFFTERSLHNTV